MIKEIEIDTNSYDKYEIKGSVAIGFIKLDKAYTIVDGNGLINQRIYLQLNDIFNLINAEEKDKVKITIEKLL